MKKRGSRATVRASDVAVGLGEAAALPAGETEAVAGLPVAADELAVAVGVPLVVAASGGGHHQREERGAQDVPG